VIPEFSPGQARYVLRRLVADGRISGAEVRTYLEGMHREIGELERQLDELRAMRGGEAAAGARTAARRGRPPAGGGTAKKARRRRRKAISSEQLASRQLQGRYLALIRQIPASRRAQYSRMVKEDGRESAVKAMTDALKK
jgi:hypothetical protein